MSNIANGIVPDIQTLKNDIKILKTSLAKTQEYCHKRTAELEDEIHSLNVNLIFLKVYAVIISVLIVALHLKSIF